MTPRRKQRLLLVALMLAGVSVAAIFLLKAFNSNIMLFQSPSDIVAGKVAEGSRFRIGGMVVEGSVERSDTGLSTRFELSDTANQVPVTYEGILPDLFSEGQGIVAMGSLDSKMPGTSANYGGSTVVKP